jgi:hypothetical protein
VATSIGENPCRARDADISCKSSRAAFQPFAATSVGPLLFSPIITAFKTARDCSSSSAVLIKSDRRSDFPISLIHSVRIWSSFWEIMSAKSFIPALLRAHKEARALASSILISLRGIEVEK